MYYSPGTIRIVNRDGMGRLGYVLSLRSMQLSGEARIEPRGKFAHAISIRSIVMYTRATSSRMCFQPSKRSGQERTDTSISSFSKTMRNRTCRQRIRKLSRRAQKADGTSGYYAKRPIRQSSTALTWAFLLRCRAFKIGYQGRALTLS